MKHLSHAYMLYVTFVTSQVVFRHPKLDASKNVQILSVLEFDEFRRGSEISRDDSNGEIHFIIRDLENKFCIFNRNYDFTIFPEIGNFSSLTYSA